MQMATDPATLDLSMFGPADMVNFVLQRSEIVSDVPNSGRIIKDWSSGDTAAIDHIVAERGARIARDAARVIGDEFSELRPVLDRAPPGRIADIGCGYALFDLFAARAYGSDLLLIDIEENDHRHFGFKSEGAAYADLARARRFLTANGVADGAIETLNPREADVLTSRPVDLAVSFLSCGFHFPVDVYMPYFRENVAKGGRILLDVRMKSYEPQAARLAELGTLSVLDETRKKRRVLVEKTT
ncbi:SAM-dependent methyltransferase [Rhodovulum iodosum]|uniref:SAM-dependent methyltransferase n=1 Tax=Rhodovulum iodosum TaxID=68291 RepID=A0ABV3XS00_9RHOB|nr:class I SAM-dependent methyltransferase [Rhodovulum robiginosum]RSK31480.1 class I SAM-dependent methyltransferase [Rhodovulum robiginosum]